MHCLDAWLAELDGALGLVSTARDRSDVENSLAALFELDTLERCADRQALARLMALPAPPGQRGVIAQLESEIRGVELERRAERLDGLLARAKDVTGSAKAVDYAPVRFAALQMRSNVELDVQQYAEAAATLRELIQQAAAVRDDRAETRAWNHLIYVLGYHRGEIDEAMSLEPAARAALARAGTPVDLHVEQLISIAQVLDQGPRAPEAITRLETARRLIEEEARTRPSMLLAEREVDVLAELANAYYVTGDLDASISAQRSTVSGYRELFGPDSLDESMALNNLGTALRRDGQLEEALVALRDAARIVELKTGESTRLASSLTNLAFVLGELGRWPEAHQASGRALAVARKHLAVGDPAFATYLSTHASSLANVGRAAEAREHYDAAVELFARDENDEMLPITLFNRGELAFDQRQLDAAEADFARSAELFARLHPTSSNVLYPLVGRGRVLVAKRAYAAAKGVLERAVAVSPQGVDQVMAASARVWLGRALVAGKLEPAKGRALIALGMSELEQLAPTSEAARRERDLLAR